MEQAGFTQAFTEALLDFDQERVDALAATLISEGEKQYFLEHTLVEAMEAIGRGWEEGEYALSQVYLSGRICEELLEQLLPKEQRSEAELKIGIATLADHHLLGKRIVHSFFQATGFPVQDLGHGMDAAELAEMVDEAKIRVLLVSVLMYNSALRVKALRQMLDQRCPGVKILVGGAPFAFAPALWQEVGADGMALHPAAGIKLVESWVKEGVAK